MTSGTTSDTIWFLDKEYSIKALEQAISKSSDTYIEPGKEIHEAMFVQTEPSIVGWANKFKKPVVTMHEGKYVIIVRTDIMNNDVMNDFWEVSADDKITVKKGFKAKFVTKYNFNQSKVVNQVAPVPVPVKEIRPAYQDKAAPQWKANNGFQKNQSSGYDRGGRNDKY